MPVYRGGNKEVILHPATGPEEGESSMGRDSNANSLVNNTETFFFFRNLFLFSLQRAGWEADVGLPAYRRRALMAVG